MLHDDALRWLKHIPISITHELLELGLARIRGGNLVITTAGLNGSPRPKFSGLNLRLGTLALHWFCPTLSKLIASLPCPYPAARQHLRSP